MINISAPVFDLDLLDSLKPKKPIKIDTQYPELYIFEELEKDATNKPKPYFNLCLGSDTSLGNP
jgi:hypothetical protein